MLTPSSIRKSLSPSASVIVLALSFVGCQRGCLSTWLIEHGVGGAAQGRLGDAAPGLDLGGTDCSDGLARCVSGRVEVSRAAHVPEPCTPTPERRAADQACTCPWEVAGSCATGCVSEGTEVAADPDVARVQLCIPPTPAIRPALPTDPRAFEICSDTGIACVEGLVRSCEGAGKSARPLASCLYGCASGVSLDATSATTAMAAIFCRRAPVE